MKKPPYKTPIAWRDCARELMSREGGYVDDPNDSGGRTNIGITENTYRRWMKLKRRPTEAEMRAITKAIASAIYFAWYWQAPRNDDLHPAVRYVVFDASVHHGAPVAATMLQTCVNAECSRLKLKQIGVDGHIGDETIQRVLDVVGCGNGLKLKVMFCARRRDRLFWLANKYKKNRNYFWNVRRKTKGGWCKRPEKDMSRALWLTKAELIVKTVKWGAK